MPLIMDRDRIPTHWAGKKSLGPLAPADRHPERAECARIALINNMPDSALEDTESQFFELLERAAADIPVHLKLYSLPEIPRSDRAKQHLNSFYFDIKDLWNRQFDGVIITGTEPRHPHLQDEPYWRTLVSIFDWAEENTTSTVLSCLAAHAGVLYSDGIGRHTLGDKQFGVFDFQRVRDHALTSGTPDLVRFPHSRWNEVREDALTSAGYEVLRQSAEAGVDMFVKRKKGSLFVHFQGHPEYGAHTLLKEYRRDIRRFLGGERETYPSMPRGYFDASATKLLTDFRENALSCPHEDLLATFPEAGVVGTLQNPWQSPATRVYHNWLQYVASKKTEAPAIAALTPVVHG
jgi:homoserine O-succinyltransferase/O-acetyltransferase